MRDSKLKYRARELRTQPTDAERKLWSLLRQGQLGGWCFRRQHPVPPYIADFACIEARLIVEADGGQHAESSYDEARDRHLQSLGWRVLRFWNPEVLTNPDGVAQTILAALSDAGYVPPPLTPPPLCRGGD